MSVRTWLIATFGLTAALAWAPVGCSSDDSQTTSGNHVTTSGGGDGGAGAGTAGPASTAGPGGSGGSGAEGGSGGEGGNGASGGCGSDSDCAEPTPYCDEGSSTCGECATDDPSTCPLGQYCDGESLECKPGCDADEDCQVGGEALTCDENEHACTGCRADGDCPPGQICSGTLCIDGCTPDHACQDGHSCCDGTCFDTTSDPQHCGSCEPCAVGANATAACNDGVCAIASCKAGYEDCNGDPADGCEANVLGSSFHCGGCGNTCDLDNAGAKCLAGECAIAFCAVGYGDCNGEPSDGCETHLASDVTSCGACNTTCDDPPGGTAACNAGKCTFGKCGSGKFDCNDQPADGCETDLQNDPENCGSCGHSCPTIAGGEKKCNKGVCAVGACSAGLGDCDGLVLTGCEADLASDPGNCGACGKVCPAVANGTAGCENAVCGIGACDPGYADCDGDAANGCEVFLANDPQNCGACGKTCAPVPGGAEACVNFACIIAQCQPGKADCFGGAANGCETTLATDVNHCGACGQSCPAIPNGERACKNGTCDIGSCDPGFANCDGQIANGCESIIDFDPQNCGGCGKTCAAPPNGLATCKSGTCAIGQCNAGFENCNHVEADGCEIDTSDDPKNCGGCGVVCGSGQCQAGKCTCVQKVLLLRDDSVFGSAVLASALTAAGYAVTTSPLPSHQYDGKTPSPAGFGAVVILAGGPGSDSFKIDMPTAGQDAIAAFVKGGNGLVLTEWAAYLVAQGLWQTLEPMVLLHRNGSFIGQVTWKVDEAFAGHPLWAGLPASFTISSPSNVGVAKPTLGVTRFAGSPEAIDAAALRDAPGEGRVVHLAHAGNYSASGWTNPNVQKLVVNAVAWTARCQ